MIFVSIGGKTAKLGDLSEIHGGSAYGAGTIAGHGDRQPNAIEIEIAEFQGYKLDCFFFRM